MKIKLLIIINQLLDEAITDAGECKPHKAFQAKVKMELVKYLNFKYRDNTIVVDYKEEYQDFLDNGPKVGFSAPTMHGARSADLARKIMDPNMLRKQQMDEAFETVHKWLNEPQG